ncbi:MAG: cytidine deaminase [Bacteroidota bacterium]
MSPNVITTEQKSWTLSFLSYADLKALPPQYHELLKSAVKVLPSAYAPYSNFHVAAAARLKNGEIVTGFNTENAAYPMCLCAERAALAAAASKYPTTPVVSLAVTVKLPGRIIDTPASPCGACRQVLAEHEQRYGHKMEIILRGEAGPIYVLNSASDLLPLGFGAEFL